MERNEILEFINKGLTYEDIDKIKTEYQVAYGRYDAQEIRAAIKDQCPVLLKDRLIVGSLPGNQFMDHEQQTFSIERNVDGIILQGKLPTDDTMTGDLLVIPGRREFEPDDRYETFITGLRLGPIFLPPHSVILNFVNPTEDQKKKKIVSDLQGAQINVYTLTGDYIGNIYHELGHLVWRTKLRYEEKQPFNELAKGIRSGAIFEYDWEKKDGEEIFCTIYKWYLRSLFVNKSFYNILNHEEPQALVLLQRIFDRLAQDQVAADVWELTKDDIYAYLNPKFDVKSGKFIRKSGMLDKIKDIDLPQVVLDDINRVDGGVEFVNLTKGFSVPVKRGRIDFDAITAKPMEKASAYYGEYRKPVIYLDMDGVIADFVAGYKEKFDRNAYKDDHFTVQQFVSSDSNFFRDLPVITRGQALYDSLKDKFNIVLITTPMEDMPFCRVDKTQWAREHFPDIKTIIFSSTKAEFASHEGAVLIDDMDYNLEPWAEAGGTAIDFNKFSNKEILDKIDDVVHPKEKIKITGKTETSPSQAQKESGNYAKGEVVYKGMKIKIENHAGSIRFGWGMDGKKWVSKMKAHYGYFLNGYDGNDGDKIDCFLNPGGTGSRVFVVNQVDKSGIFDEHKVMLGYGNIIEAERAYLANYQAGWTGLGSIIQSNTKKLREWLETGNHYEAFKL